MSDNNYQQLPRIDMRELLVRDYVQRGIRKQYTSASKRVRNQQKIKQGFQSKVEAPTNKVNREEEPFQVGQNNCQGSMQLATNCDNSLEGGAVYFQRDCMHISVFGVRERIYRDLFNLQDFDRYQIDKYERQLRERRNAGQKGPARRQEPSASRRQRRVRNNQSKQMEIQAFLVLEDFNGSIVVATDTHLILACSKQAQQQIQDEDGDNMDKDQQSLHPHKQVIAPTFHHKQNPQGSLLAMPGPHNLVAHLSQQVVAGAVGREEGEGEKREEAEMMVVVHSKYIEEFDKVKRQAGDPKVVQMRYSTDLCALFIATQTTVSRCSIQDCKFAIQQQIQVHFHSKSIRDMVLNASRNEIITIEEDRQSYKVMSQNDLENFEEVSLPFEPQSVMVGSGRAATASSSFHKLFYVFGGTKGQILLHEPDKKLFVDFSRDSQHNGPVTQVVQVHDFVVSVGEDCQMLVWSLRDLMCISKLKCADKPSSMVLLNHDKYLLLCTSQGNVYRYILPEVEKACRRVKMNLKDPDIVVNQHIFAAYKGGIILIGYNEIFKMRPREDDLTEFDQISKMDILLDRNELEQRALDFRINESRLERIDQTNYVRNSHAYLVQNGDPSERHSLISNLRQYTGDTDQVLFSSGQDAADGKIFISDGQNIKTFSIADLSRLEDESYTLRESNNSKVMQICAALKERYNGQEVVPSEFVICLTTAFLHCFKKGNNEAQRIENKDADIQRVMWVSSIQKLLLHSKSKNQILVCDPETIAKKEVFLDLSNASIEGSRGSRVSGWHVSPELSKPRKKSEIVDLPKEEEVSAWAVSEQVFLGRWQVVAVGYRSGAIDVWMVGLQEDGEMDRIQFGRFKQHNGHCIQDIKFYAHPVFIQAEPQKPRNQNDRQSFRSSSVVGGGDWSDQVMPMVVMASVDDNKTVNITSLNEQILVKQLTLADSADKIEFLTECKCLVVYCKSRSYFQVVDMDFLRSSEQVRRSSVKYNMFRQLVQGSDEEQLSCVQLLKDEVFLAYNINLVSLLSMEKASRCLEEALKLGLPQLIDCDGNTPFKNSRQVYQKNCSVLLEYQSHPSISFVQTDCFLEALEMKGQQMIQFFNSGLFCEPQLEGNRNKDKLFGLFKNGKDQHIFSERSQILSNHQLDTHIAMIKSDTENQKDQSAEGGKQQFIECKVSKMSLNLSVGTKGSIELLKHLSKAKEDMFYGQLQIIIDHKWNQNIRTIKIQAALNFFHVFLLGVHLVILQDVRWFTWILLSTTIAYFLQVLLNIYVSEHKCKSYFSTLWNKLDFAGSITLLIHCVGFLLSVDDVSGIEKFYEVYAWFTLVAAFCLLLRGVTRISPFFTNFRLLIGVFTQTFSDIKAFLFLFVYMIGSMSLLHLIVKRINYQIYFPFFIDDLDQHQADLTQEFPRSIGFSYSLRETYQQTFGENPDEDSQLNIFTVYIVATVFLNIVAMNLLISIIQDTYDKVTMTQQAADYKQRLDLLLESERIHKCFGSGFSCRCRRGAASQRNQRTRDPDPQYLHVLSYSQDFDAYGAQGGDAWEGNIRVLKKSLGETMHQADLLRDQVTGCLNETNSEFVDLRQTLSELKNDQKRQNATNQQIVQALQRILGQKEEFKD